MTLPRKGLPSADRTSQIISDQCLPADGAFFAREHVFAQTQLCWQRNPVLHGINANCGKNGGKLIAFFVCFGQNLVPIALNRAIFTQ